MGIVKKTSEERFEEFLKSYKEFCDSVDSCLRCPLSKEVESELLYDKKVCKQINWLDKDFYKKNKEMK